MYFSLASLVDVAATKCPSRVQEEEGPKPPAKEVPNLHPEEAVAE